MDKPHNYGTIAHKMGLKPCKECVYKCVAWVRKPCRKCYWNIRRDNTTNYFQQR